MVRDLLYGDPFEHLKRKNPLNVVGIGAENRDRLIKLLSALDLKPATGRGSELHLPLFGKTKAPQPRHDISSTPLFFAEEKKVRRTGALLQSLINSGRKVIVIMKLESSKFNDQLDLISEWRDKLNNILFLLDSEHEKLTSFLPDGIDVKFYDNDTYLSELLSAELGLGQISDTALGNNEDLSEIKPKEDEKEDEVDSENNSSSLIEVNDEYTCFYHEVMAMPDPTGNNSHTSVSNLIILGTDLDGTQFNLSHAQYKKAFALTQFVQKIYRHDWLKSMLSNAQIPTKDQAENLRAVDEFLSLYKQLENDEKKMAYEEILKSLNRAYARIVQGLRVTDVCRAGSEFSIEHFKNHRFSHAIPILSAARYMGMEPMAITGMPAEMMHATMEGFGMKLRPFPLVLGTCYKNGNLFYTGEVVRHGGISEDKEEISAAVRSNGNYMPVFFGDQVSDGQPMADAMGYQEIGVRGRSYLIANPDSEDGRKVLEYFSQSHRRNISKGQMVIVDPKNRGWANALRLVQDMYGVARTIVEKKHEKIINGEEVLINPLWQKVMERAGELSTSVRIRNFLRETSTGHRLGIYSE